MKAHRMPRISIEDYILQERESGNKYEYHDGMYRQIPSLQEYVLIAQDRPQVEVYYKKPETDLWRITRFEGLESKIQLQALEIEIQMAELYFDIDIEN